MVLFSACQKSTFVTLSENTKILEYKASTTQVTVKTAGNWTLEGTYDWVTPSATSGANGDVITFTTTLNVTGSIRNASYTIKSEGAEAKLTITQKSGVLDAVPSLSVVSIADKAKIQVSVVTANADDYKEWGVLYATENNVAKATPVVGGSNVAEGGVVEVNLNPDTDNYVWAYVTALNNDVIKAESSTLLIAPLIVNAGEDLQAAINGAREGIEIRLPANAEFKGNFTAKSNITISGGWNADFTAREGYTTLNGNFAGIVLVLPEGSENVVIEGLKITKGKERDGAGIQANGKAIIKNCWFENNFSTHRGGGLGSIPDAALVPGEAEITVANCVFTKNAAHEHGSAVCVEYHMKATFVNNLIHDNYSAQNDEWYNFVTYAGGTFINNTFVNNHMTSGSNYDCVYARNWENAVWDLIIVNNVIVGNDAKKIDHTLVEEEFPSFEGSVRNAKQIGFAGEYTGDRGAEFGITVVVEKNVIEGYIGNDQNQPYNSKNTLLPLGGDLTGVFADFAGANYALKAGSPAVDLGASTELVNSILNVYNTDLAGNPRVVGASVDAGCYELQ